MAKIKTFELDRWSEPDEKRRVRHIGMADAKETFDRLQTHLELKGLLPDEYFLFSDELTGELPEFDQALCIPNFGASEGIYLDISLACRDKDGKRYFQNFATGKTLGETADDYYRMFRIAAECSLMLNGRGNTYEQKKVDIVLTEQDRYSSFEKIESAARKRALAFANQKNADALRTFMDDEEMQKAIHAVQGGSRVDSDL